MRRELVILFFACLPAAGLAGCRTTRTADTEDRRPRETVTPAQFVLAEGEPRRSAPAAPDAQPAAAPPPAPSAPPPVFVVQPGAPAGATGPARPVADPVLLEAKVGDINGRPVFAGEFLKPLEGRLRAKALEVDRDTWLRFAAQQIQEQLRSEITDELLRAEALSRLSVEQKAGLRRFLQDVRDNLISQSGGSSQRAASRLKREQGLSEQDYLKQQEERTLVRFTIQEQISSRVNVSWRDIVRRYRRDAEKYHPEPSARFYIIRVDKDDQEAEQRVRQALAAGTPFAEVAASDVNTWTDEGGLKVIPFTPPRAEADFFGPDEINNPARTLDAGQWTGPIEFGSSLIWLYLDSIEQKSVSLYDAQLDIASQIRGERVNKNLQQYIDRLLGRASVTDISAMMVRLLNIAADRYAPAAGPAASPGTQ